MNSTSFDKLLRQVVVVPVCALMLTAGILVWQVLTFSHTVSAMEKADRIIANIIEIEELVVDQETGLRGYQLTGDRSFLGPFEHSNESLDRRFKRLEEQDTSQEELRQIVRIETDHQAWVSSFALPLIYTVERGNSTLGAPLNFEGKRQMDSIRAEISSLENTAQIRRDDGVQLWRSQLRNLSLAFLLLALAVGLMLGLYVRHLLHLVSAAYRDSHQALRIRADQAFRSEEKLRTTVESIGDGVITCDADGRIQTLNRVARELTGWSSEEAAERPLEEVFNILDEVSRTPAESPVDKVKRLNSAISLSDHTILVRRDGSELFIDDSGAPIRDKFGRLIGIVLVFRDITEAKRSRDALLANEKLAIAGRLAASIAHEIHNPLDSVANILFLMEGNEDADENVQFLDLARQEISRVTQISRAMLSLYRESRTPVSLDLKDMLRSILLLTDRRFKDLQVTVSCEVEPDLNVLGFPAELRQVFTNLLSNAAEASGPGGTVEVTVRPAHAGDMPDGQPLVPGYFISVTDHGPGIDEQIMDQLFKPFFSTKGEAGTGLGLWISRGIVNKHGGTLSLSSNQTPEHHGTTATVFLACNPSFSASAP